MSYIFLDIDGVLRTDKSDLEWSLILKEPIPKSVFKRKFNKRAISALNEIRYYVPNLKVIITSTWRNKFTVEELNNIFKQNGYSGTISDKTSDIGYRGEEILEYLTENNINDKYVVIDDNINNIALHIESKRIIKIDYKEGFNGDYFDNIIDLL